MKPDHGAPAEQPPGAALLLPIALLVIAALTLVPDTPNASVAASTPLWCLACGTFGMVDVICNVLLFLPLGAALAWRGWRVSRAVLGAFLLSFVVELTQYMLLTGRDASLSDLLTNTAGSLSGAFMATRWRSIHRPSSNTAGRLAALSATAFLIITIGTSWLTMPSFTTVAWYGQIRPDLGHLSLFEGIVEHTTVADRRSLPGTRLSAELSSEARALPMLSADVGTAPAPAGIAPIAAIFDRQRDEQLLLGRYGDALVFRARLRSADALLGRPSLRLPTEWPRTAERSHVEGGLQDGNLLLRVVTKSGVRRASMHLGPGWGWRLIIPIAVFAPTEGQARLLNALWLGLAAFPLGWFAGWWACDARSAAASVGGVAAVILTALVAVPTWLHSPAADGLEVCSALAGTAVAAQLVRISRRYLLSVTASP